MLLNCLRKCMIWENLIQCKNNILDILNLNCVEYFEDGMDRFNKTGWVNRTWKNDHVRRAHVDVVDARETKGLWTVSYTHLTLPTNREV